MNLFLEYQIKVFKSLKKLEKKKIIQIPSHFKIFTIEPPPRNQNADISCNAAMILAKSNKLSPIKLAEIIKPHLLKNFKEFKKIEIASPGFLNIHFNEAFWKKYLEIINQLGNKFGAILFLTIASFRS